MLSKSCKYALRATLFIAHKAPQGVRLGVRDIAREIDAPEAFTAKILQSLARDRVISSVKGPNGGFFIAPGQAELPLINVVHAIDGLGFFYECGLGLKQCSDQRPCPLHHQYKAAREALRSLFQQTSIGDLAQNLQTGTAFINNF
jgi:Rrf2 family protein